MEVVWELILGNLGAIIATALSFVMGLVIKSPVYQKAKSLIKSLAKALEDDKLTKDEVNEIISHFK